MEVLIAEDHFLTAQLLAKTLAKNDDINVIGIVSDGYKVIEVISQRKVDICLLDISMPNLNGLEALKILARKKKKVKFLILSGHIESWIIEKALKYGAYGYITKKADIEEVIKALHIVYSGEKYLDAVALDSLKSSNRTLSLQIV